jgi:hypothetical protein
MRKTASILLIALCFTALAAAAPQGQGPDAEKRQRLIEVVRKLEQSPLDKGLQRDGDRAMEWVMTAPGGQMRICGKSLGDFYQEKPEYKYHQRIITQLMLASAAFAFEHPEQADDEMAEYTASMESALKVYSAILKSKPDARSKALDALAQTQADGKLPSYIRQRCGSERQASEVRVSAPAMPRQQAGAPAEKAQAQPKPAEKHSSPEDRQRLVAVAHKLEAAPLDPALGPDRAWAVQWVVAAPDVHAKVCTNLLADLRRPRYKYRSQITDQLLLSSAAFLIEHPEKGDGVAAQSVGGMEGVLKAYSAILKADPQATARPLDDFLEKQKEGKLAAAVQEIAKGCQ